jgi:hypothetical protein
MDGMDWIDLAQVRNKWRALVNTVMNLRVLENAGKFLSSCTIGSFSKRTRLQEWVSGHVLVQAQNVSDLRVKRSTLSSMLWSSPSIPTPMSAAWMDCALFSINFWNYESLLTHFTALLICGIISLLDMTTQTRTHISEPTTQASAQLKRLCAVTVISV